MSDETTVDHYEILGVHESADLDAIEKAYRAGLARIRASLGGENPLPAEFLDRLRAAYHTLIDPLQRASYDQKREAAAQPADAARAPEAVTHAADEVQRFQFLGSGADYFRIWVVNLVLTVLTLGIYSAWAKVRREQFFHRNTLLAGSGFDYHGNPKAILKGRIVVAVLLVALSLSEKISPLLYLGLLLLAMPLAPWLWMRSLRFRAANTSYRGLRFHHAGTYPKALLAMVGHGLLVLIGGFWFPMWQRALVRFQMEHLSYGGVRWHCQPSRGRFYLVFVVAGALSLLPMFFMGVVLGTAARGNVPKAELGLMMLGALALVVPYFKLIVRPYLVTRLANLTWNATSIDGRAFTSSQTYGGFFKLNLVNFMLIVLTLGLYWPWAKVREVKYRLDHLALCVGDLDAFEAQVELATSAVGEEIADAFDLDFSL